MLDKESFMKNIAWNINWSADVIIKKASHSALKFLFSLWLWFFLVQKLIVPYMLHDIFVILNWTKLIWLWVLTLIVWLIIFLLSEAITKILMYLFR